MLTLSIHLFGKFSVDYEDQPLTGLDACKVQELFSYLLVRRNRPHPREALAAMLWGDVATDKSKKYLRQSLWRLQTALDADGMSAGILTAEHDWVQLNLRPGLWLDIEVFEYAFAAVKDQPGRELDAQTVAALREAVRLYRGDLLEGWYQDWCLFERERLQNIYLAMLYKLLSYCEAHEECEAGQFYGSLLLYHDRASERTHRHLMYLYYMAGDRTAALRQYERCVAALDEELGVRPDRRTVRLYEQIRADGVVSGNSPATEHTPTAAPPLDSLPDVLSRLQRLQDTIAEMHARVQQDIRSVESSLRQKAQHLLNR
jgi:DNA-binding SARP family transcriptional activator